MTARYLPRVERLLKKAKFPELLPEGMRISLRPGPAYGGQFSYYDPEQDTVYWIDGEDVYAFMHELGHVFDRKYLLDEHRALLMRMLGGRPRPWFWGERDPINPHGPDAYEEVFADAYARAQIYRLKMIRLRRLLRKVKP